MEYLLEARNLEKLFPIHGGVFFRQIGAVNALNGVSFGVEKGKTLGLVGESGCGKTTLGRVLLRLHEPSAGEIFFNGRNISKLSPRKLRPIRREMQMIFQDPFESLNPRNAVEEILSEPFIIHKIGSPEQRAREVGALLEKVGLPVDCLRRYPHEFSGGQRQRLGIARAIALNPKLIVCDEPVSALDVSIQAQILNLLLDLQRELSLTYVFIAHDLAVVKYISDRIAVMYLGKIVEMGDARAVCDRALHPYTQALISAVPDPDPTSKKEKIILKGEVPSPINPPSGCHFHPRCPYAQDICENEEPLLKSSPSGNDHQVACHFAGVVSKPETDIPEYNLN